jgi:multisubunit Na+/H+ antiporter MnhB subunit
MTTQNKTLIVTPVAMGLFFLVYRWAFRGPGVENVWLTMGAGLIAGFLLALITNLLRKRRSARTEH